MQKKEQLIVISDKNATIDHSDALLLGETWTSVLSFKLLFRYLLSDPKEFK